MEFDFTKEPGLVLKNKESVGPELALISIVTPFYNAGKYFEQTFNSVMNQTFPWFEWIVVDDGSTECEDVEVLENICKRDNRIRIIYEKNGGPSHARNVGFQNAKTDIVIPLDADDVISPQYLEYLYWGLYFNPDAAWCYTHSLGFQDDEYLWKRNWDSEKLKTENYLCATAAIRKKDAEEIGWYKIEDKPYNEDWRFWLDMLAKKKKPVVLCGYHFWYRRTEKGRLSGIKKDEERIKFDSQIIKKAASNVKESVEAIEFPLRKTKILYHMPQVIDLGEAYRIPKPEGKIRIMLLIPWMVMGGADKFNLDLIAGLNKEKYEISILTTVPSENDWQQKFEEYTDDIFNLPDFLDPAYFAEFVSYYIKSRNVDILLSTNSERGYYMFPWLRKEFPELSIIDYVHMEEWYWKAGGFARMSGVFGKFVYKTYVCNSETRNVLIKYFERNPSSVETLYIGVDQDRFDRNKVEEGYLHEKLKLEKDVDIVLFPCRITPQKRPFMILDIATKVYALHKKVAFVVVGDGEQFDELKREIKKRKLEKVIFCIGRCNEIEKCYRDSKVTLICSLKEGLALTAYESCSMSVPVISSDVGGQGDLIDDSVGKIIPLSQSEETDYDVRKFPVEEIKKYVDAIIELLTDKDRYMYCSINCRKKIETGFSTKKMVENFKQIADNLITDEIRAKNRADSLKINEMGMLAEELYSVNVHLEERVAESIIVWDERCWFRDRLNEELVKNSELQNKMSAVENSRAWKIVNKYYYVANENVVAKTIRKILKKCYRMFRK